MLRSLLLKYERYTSKDYSNINRRSDQFKICSMCEIGIQKVDVLTLIVWWARKTVNCVFVIVYLNV